VSKGKYIALAIGAVAATGLAVALMSGDRKRVKFDLAKRFEEADGSPIPVVRGVRYEMPIDQNMLADMIHGRDKFTEIDLYRVEDDEVEGEKFALEGGSFERSMDGITVGASLDDGTFYFYSDEPGLFGFEVKTEQYELWDDLLLRAQEGE